MGEEGGGGGGGGGGPLPAGYCCVCVEKREELRNVGAPRPEGGPAGGGDGLTLLEKLRRCAPTLEWDPGFCLCGGCAAALDAAFDFLRRCADSERLRAAKARQLLEAAAAQQQQQLRDQFRCEPCDRRFRLARFLKAHTTRVHGAGAAVKAEVKEEPIAADDEHDDGTYGDDGRWSDAPEEPEPAARPARARADGRKRGPKKRDPLNCEYCGKLFNRRQHWAAHIRANHTFERPYACGLCDAAFVNSHSLLVHKRNHNNEKPYVCTACGKSFVCSGDLYHHSKIHLNKREYQCDVCQKRFNTTSILRTHKIVKHTPPAEWKYACEQCGRRFPIRSSLAAHGVRHTGVRSHACHVCAKEFYSRSELSKHVASHGGDRLYRCVLCEAREYKSREGLRRHLRTAHGGDEGRESAAPAPKRHACHLCPKRFAHANKLRRHLCSHTGERPFGCPLCAKRFVDSYGRRAHLRKEHGREPRDVDDEDGAAPPPPPPPPPPATRP